MDAHIILAGFVIVPAVAVVLLRSNGILVFLSVCLGSVLAAYVAGDASSVISGASRSGALVTMQWTQLGLLVVPVLCTVLLTRKKLKGFKLLLGFVAAIAAGALLALLGMQYLSSALQESIYESTAWHELNNLETAVILTGATITFLYLLMTRWRPEGDKKHK
jgi:zinc transporter ZupT